MAGRKRSKYATDRATSKRMSSVRPIDTRPERLVRRILTDMGIRYRIHGFRLPGRPDVVFHGRRKVIFVHGCFWHRHPECPRATTPARNARLWAAKFAATMARDRRNAELLGERGWQCLVVWECQLGVADEVQAVLAAFLGGE